jgi:arabinose-5-phosphate isomerase
MIDFKTVLENEANAILEAKDNLDNNKVNEIVELLANIKGKLIIVGLGKPGHIGKKLAASFASMGTPSFFVHATELFHGDFGMVQNQDIILLLSHSGTTLEVLEAAKTFKSRGNKLIAITNSDSSPLAMVCDYLLNYGVTQETDHLNMAPSNSSTVMLAIGDALMITVSERRGYRKEDFKMNHPGGALGEK